MLSDFTAVANAIGATTSKLEKERLLAGYLVTLDDASLERAVVFLSGSPFPQREERVTGVGGAIISDAVSVVAGRNPEQIGALVDPLVNQVCRVNINCQCQRGPDVFPFAGRKDSAEGTLSVTDALRAFSIRSMVAVKQTETGEDLLDAIVVQHKSKFVNTRFIF